MEIFVKKDSNGNCVRARINRPYINMEEYDYNTSVYTGQYKPVGLYEQTMGPDWLAKPFSHTHKNFCKK